MCIPLADSVALNCNQIIPICCIKTLSQTWGRWVYALGVGDTYMAEYITIVFLSLYVYKTAIFDEIIQVSLAAGDLYLRSLLHCPFSFQL